jgi:hypothetical protein
MQRIVEDPRVSCRPGKTAGHTYSRNTYVKLAREGDEGGYGAGSVVGAV